MRRLSILFSFVLLFLMAHVSWGGSDEDPFEWNYDGSSRSVTAGEEIPLQVNFTIPPGHYLYREKMALDLLPLVGFSLTPLELSPSHRRADPFTGKVEEIFEDSAVLQTHVKIDPNTPSGEYLLKIELAYQGCSSQLCYRLLKRELLLPIEVRGVGTTRLPDQPQFSFDGKGLGSMILLSFLAGVATDFTPCVLPIVPITLAFIGVRREGRRRRNTALTLAFIGAMALTYAALGVGAASLGKSLGFLFQSKFFLVFTILLYLVFSLSLFGLFEIQIPLRFRNALTKVGGAGFGGAALAGITTGFLAAPCVGPLIGSLLLYVVTSRDLVRGFVLLFAFGLGMGSLFLVAAVFYHLFISKIHGGRLTLWMKRVLALLLLIPAAYYTVILVRGISPLKAASHSSFWSEDVEAVLKKARNENKRVLIDFYATWCLPCLEMEKKTFSRPEVQEEVLKNFVPLRVNCTEETKVCHEMVEKYHVIGWPTLVVATQEGRVIDKVVGRVFSPAELKNYLNSLLRR